MFLSPVMITARWRHVRDNRTESFPVASGALGELDELVHRWEDDVAPSGHPHSRDERVLELV